MKLFKTDCVDKKEFRKFICKVAKDFGVNKVIFSDRGRYVSGTYNAFNKNMFLDLKMNKKQTLTTFFHELGHHIAVKKNLFKKYHFNLCPSINVEQAFVIENKIDKIAQGLWNKYVVIKTWGRYNYAYPKSQKTKIMNHFLSARV
jgi:hypothetical protein